MAAYERAQGGAQLGLLGGIAPQHVLEEEQVFFLDCRTPGEKRPGAEHGQRLAVAAIGSDDLLAAELTAQIREAAQHSGRHGQACGLVLELGEHGDRQQGRARRGRRFEHAQETKVLLHVTEDEAQQEPIVERGELVFFGQLVGGPEQREQRDRLDDPAVVEAPLVHQREDGVQDRRVGLEDFVEERDVRLGQLCGRHPAIFVGFQRLQAHRPEDLFRRGELGQQPLEVARAVDATAELVGQHRFGGAGRADQQDVRAGEQGDERSLDHLAALDERLFQLVANARQGLERGHDSGDERSVYAIDVRGELEVSLGQSPGGMRPQRERDLAVVDEDVGMVVFDLGQVSHAVDESHRFAKVREAKRLLDRLTLELPAGERRQPAGNLVLREHGCHLGHPIGGE